MTLGAQCSMFHIINVNALHILCVLFGVIGCLALLIQFLTKGKSKRLVRMVGLFVIGIILWGFCPKPGPLFSLTMNLNSAMMTANRTNNDQNVHFHAGPSAMIVLCPPYYDFKNQLSSLEQDTIDKILRDVYKHEHAS